MLNKGLFITFEGGEGTGKTTLIDKLEKALQSKGVEVLKTREPGGSKLGEQIRSLLLNNSPDVKVSSLAELYLFLAARTQHIQECILPAIESGKIVLCDRFNDSTVAYQGYARHLGADFVQKQCEIACTNTLPNLTFYLDLDPVIGLERAKQAYNQQHKEGEIDRIESELIEFHQQVRHAMQEIAQQNPTRIKTIDARQSPEEVFNQALAIIESQINHVLY